MHQKPTAAAPSAPPLSPAWAENVHVYAVPVARPVEPFAPPALPPPPPPPPPSPPSLNDRRQPTRRRVAVNVHTENHFCPSVWPALWFASHMLAYQVANACVGLVGALVVVVGLALSLVLLPLCGFGLVVLTVTVRTAYQLSWFDAKMHNTIPLEDHETIAFPEEDAERRPLLPVHDPRRASTSSGRQRPRFADEALSQFTPRALSLLVYFGVVKPVLGLLSVLSLAFIVVLALSLVSDHARVTLDIDTPTQLKVDTAEWSALGRAIGVLVCAVLLHGLTRGSLRATRFFCCARQQLTATHT